MMSAQVEVGYLCSVLYGVDECKSVVGLFCTLYCIKRCSVFSALECFSVFILCNVLFCTLYYVKHCSVFSALECCSMLSYIV